MRVFLSSFEKFIVAVPINFVSGIFIFRGENEDKQKEYVSLPEVFNNQNLNVKHGLIIKNSSLILLTTKIDCEIDIPNNEIFSLPKAFDLLQFSHYFSGIKIAKNKLILFLNPKYLEKNIEKEAV